MIFAKNLRLHAKFWLASAAALGLAAIILPAHAGTLDASAGIVDGTNINNGRAVVTHDGTPAQVVGVYGHVDGNATASAGYGVLHAYAHGVASNTLGYAYVSCSASFDDMITINGGTGTGYFNSDMILDGTIFNGGGFPSVGVTWTNYIGSTNLFESFQQTASGPFIYQGNKTIPFTFGVPFDFSASITANVIWSNTSGGGFGEGLDDFANTATIGNIQVLDSNFNPVSNFTVSGTSAGTDYTNLVPEPASASLLLIGALVPLVRRKR